MIKDIVISGKSFPVSSTKINLPMLPLKGSQMLEDLKNYSRRPGRAFFLTRIVLILIGCGSLLVSDVRAASLELPVEKNFQSGGFDSDWQTNVSSETSFAIKDGSLNFDAPAHAKAFVCRDANVDLITYSGKITRWGAIYLVWGEKNWCAIGQLSPTPFGQLYTTVVTNGTGGETDHRGVDFNYPRWVRIQLGGNYIRFYFSNDEKSWSVLRTIERPSSFAGAPKLIAAGKYSTRDDQPFANGNAFSAGDGRMDGRILALHAEATPEAARNLTDAELEEVRKPYVEPVNALLQKIDVDPSFEEVAPHYPAMKFPREILGVPSHPLAIGIDWQGRLDVSPWTAPTAWFEIGNPPVPFATNSTQLQRRMLRGYLPIETLSTERDGVHYELTVFGWSDGFHVDRPLFAYAHMTAHSLNGTPLPHEIALVTPDNKRQTWKMSLAKDGDAQFFLRLDFPNTATATEVSADEFNSKQAEVAQYWENRLAPGNRFDVPDERVMEAYRAWLTYSMLNTKNVNGYIEPHDGSGFYTDMFGCSVSVRTRALDCYGFPEDAAEVLATQLHVQQPNGLYVDNCGLIDAGSLLVALAHHYKMTGDREWLWKVRPHIDSQCEWLIQQRQAAPHEGMLRGLIKFRPYNDYPEPVYNYLGNAWSAKGMEEVAEVLKEINAPESARYAAEAKSFREDILNSMSAAAFVDDGQTILPLEPDTHRLLKLTRNRGGSYYGLTAGDLLESDFLPPNDKRTTWIVDMLEKRGGLIAGLCEFEGGIDHAYTYGYLILEMQRQEIRKTLLGFWSMLAFGMTRDTYSPVEVSMIETGENHYTLPHLYSLTEQLRLFRNLLVREDNEVLWLGQAIPTAWLAAGKHVAVNNAPSEFGDLSYRIDSHTDGNMHISLNPPSRRLPKEIRLCLRQQKNLSIVSVKTIPVVPLEFSGQTVVFSDLKTPIDIEVTFK
jgi:hypothetical protein